MPFMNIVKNKPKTNRFIQYNGGVSFRDPKETDRGKKPCVKPNAPASRPGKDSRYVFRIRADGFIDAGRRC